ncbi:MAG: Cation-efflux family protein [Candidatus Moranbacteria bacterium GW2011_GWE1_35_17]|nr:MAG: Cation-efflux family protein [Candidatus Moranbacteria bacterium GW2011_GWE1_35_17]KKP71968.1 MAG: Cation-efflux family protein [Candidatus Moranbacteria bacterium GW2011_GWE2_35_164]KKP84190.1 MAG: Cation-efflux family protein [Candidatus Moranbacteria bacterium GW2011_GWF1_35_5]
MEGYITGFSNILNTQAALFFAGLKQMNNFNSLAMQALPPFLTAEKTRKSDPGANWDLFMGNLNSGLAGLGNGFTAIGKMQRNLLEDQITAWAKGGNAYADVAKRQLTAIQAVGTTYPEAIEAIGPEFGFNYDGGLGFPVMVHTLRFNLCKVLPSVPGVVTKLNSKPIVVIPPFVLGANILALLPGEGRSYLHAFANAGIPTYILIMKPITSTPAVRKMTLENIAMDVKYFCQYLKNLHYNEVTINGYCQGGTVAAIIFMSGILKGLANKFITCVAPMDGTLSKGLTAFLFGLPERFRDLAYGTTLIEGDPVASGPLMSYVYKAAALSEGGDPLTELCQTFDMLHGIAKKNGGTVETHDIPKIILAIQYWLKNNRTDIPMSVTDMSFKLYTIPTRDDGTLPLQLFGRPLNFKWFREHEVPWLICHGERDDLVERRVALAPTKWLDGFVEVTPFPKGHVAIATSWSVPGSKCPLDGEFTIDGRTYRGPVKFHLDLPAHTSASASVYGAHLRN